MPRKHHPATEEARAADEAGLRYVSDTAPGIRRVKAGTGFRYVKPDGSALKDPREVARIRALAIPPAYTDVWISPDPRGHLQATGRDARGRKQYRYHPKWRETRDATKFDRMLAFSRVLPAIRRRVAQDLGRPGLPREKVLATVVRLLESTAIRVGNDEYAKSNRSYGLTTLRNRHVAVKGRAVEFEFRGKAGKVHRASVSDPRLARVIARCQAIPGEELFQYLDEDGTRHPVDSGDVNDYLRAVSGGEFTAKDFRTWNGTLLALAELRAEVAAESVTARERQLVAVIDRVAERLNNTRAVCRRYYVHPALLEAFRAGTLGARMAGLGAGRAGRRAGERALIHFLKPRRTR